MQRVYFIRREKEKSKSGRIGLSFTNRRKRQSSTASVEESSVVDTSSVGVDPKEQALKDKASALTTQAASLQKQFALLRHTAKDELLSLQSQSQEWSNQAGLAVSSSIAETTYLKEKLAAESAMRLKLLNELQDIRGTVRVYCRPKPSVENKSILTIPTHDILVLNEEGSPMSFKFDRVFSPHASQYEVFSELEEPLISSLDGFNVTLLAFGQCRSGKTHSVLGDCVLDSSGTPRLESQGVQLQALKQLFNIAGHRTDRYKDAVSMTILEVHNEKLIDLLAGTPSADEHGQIIICETRDRRDKRKKNNELNNNSDWHKGKLEIRTNIDGNTVVQGLVSIPIHSYEDATTIWNETLAKRAERLKQGGFDPSNYEKNSNVITTFQITSVNIATGVGTEGKLQFVDMAASDIAHGVKKMEDAITTNEDNIHFCNKSIDALNDVVNARCQFDRSVPYRNSTLTHLLRDSLEADAKVLLLCCVSSDASNLSDTIGTLRFGSRMQKVSIGKATKHIVGSKE
jgi:kinesin family protein C2/C3